MSRFPTASRDSGASSVEYGLLVVLIAAAIVTAVFAFGGMTTKLFTETCDEVSDNAPSVNANCE